MRVPTGYNEAAAYTGDFEKITPGAYICKITNVREEVSPDTWRLVLAFDIAEGEHAGFYGRQHDKFGGRWGGVYRQNVERKDGRCSPFFKGMITTIEESNPGYLFDFNNERGLIGKLFGGIFGEEEYMANDGEVKTACKCLQMRSVKAIRDGNYKIPEKKTYQPAAAAAPASSLAGFSDITMEDCPF